MAYANILRRIEATSRNEGSTGRLDLGSSRKAKGAGLKEHGGTGKVSNPAAALRPSAARVVARQRRRAEQVALESSLIEQAEESAFLMRTSSAPPIEGRCRLRANPLLPPVPPPDGNGRVAESALSPHGRARSAASSLATVSSLPRIPFP